MSGTNCAVMFDQRLEVVNQQIDIVFGAVLAEDEAHLPHEAVLIHAHRSST